MTAWMNNRNWIAAGLAAGIARWFLLHWPFPGQDPLLQIVHWNRPALFFVIKYAYLAMCFTTPLICLCVAGSLLYIFVIRWQRPAGLVPLPRYPEPAGRSTLYLVLGEVHHPKRPEPAAEPSWLTIPERGLYTGIAVFGA